MAGLYQFEMSILAVSFRIGDAYALFVGVLPTLIALWYYRRGSLRDGRAETSSAGRAKTASSGSSLP